jgi:WD40 repeat protein
VHYVDLVDLTRKSTVKPKEEVQYVDAFQDKIFIFTHKAIYKLEDEKLETIVSISANYKFRSFDREYGRAVYSNKESIHIYDIKTNVDYTISCPKGCSLYFDEGVVFYDLGVFLAFNAKTSTCLCNFSFTIKNILWERSFSNDNGSMISLASDVNHVAISFRWSTGPFLEVYDVNSGDPLILSRSSDLKNRPMDYSGHKLVIHDQLLFCSYENKLFIWDLPNNKLKSVFKLQYDICNICQFEISKNFVAVNCFQPPDQVTYPISIFDIKTEQVVGTVPEVARFQKFHFSLEKNPCLIQIGDKNTLVFRRYSKEAREKNLNDMGQIFSCSFHNAQT